MRRGGVNTGFTVFRTWFKEMFIFSNMRGDISLLNVYCSVEMIEVCLWSKKSAIRWVFGPHPPLNRQGPDLRLFFCAVFTSYYEESDRGQTITAKKTTKSLISNQKTQEYIKSKCPICLYLFYRKISKNNDI